MHIDPLTITDMRTPVVIPPRPMWRVGAILEAIAIREVSSGQLWLEFANRERLPARLASGHSNGPLDGEQLKLRVLRDSPVLALEALDTEDLALAQAAQNALRRYLPLQNSPAPLLANLGWLMRHPEQLERLPGSVQLALLRLWQSLPSSDSLQHSQPLHTALRQSGTFMEFEMMQQDVNDTTRQQLGNQVSNQPANLLADYKAALLALREQLRQAPSNPGAHPQPAGPLPSMSEPLVPIGPKPASLLVVDDVREQLAELKQQTEGSLARIHSNQLLNAEAAQQGLLTWLIELPVKNQDQAELLRFKFAREQRNEEDDTAWSVEVALDLGQLGSLHAQVTLNRQGITVRLRSDSAAMVAALHANSEQLASALRQEGLPLERILCLHGHPVDAPASRLARLLDLHA